MVYPQDSSQWSFCAIIGMGIVGSALCAGLMPLNLSPVHFAEPYRKGGKKPLQPLECYL